jgi:protein-disulfide isomerase
MPDSAVASLFQSLGDATRGASLEQMRPALREWLERNTEPELARVNYLEELMKVSTRVETLLAAPRVQVERSAQDIVLGPPSAPVEIVAFGDFQNADYARLSRAFASVRETFGDRVRIVFKNLPALGPDSVAAAEAAECANAQGKFWAFHDALLTSTESTSAARLAGAVAGAGVARDALQACVDGGRFRDLVRQGLDEAERYGIPGSPSFLVNGRLAPNPPPFLPPFDFFKRLIEEELSRAAKGDRR